MALNTQFLSITPGVDKQIEKAIKNLELNVGRVFAGIVENAFSWLVLETPQWSGRMAASWNMTVNRASLEPAPESKFPYVKNPYQKGDMKAVRYALSRAQGKSATFKNRFEAHGWTIQIHNGVEYAGLVNSGAVELRAEVGHSPGFFDNFKARVKASQAHTDADWAYYANTDFLGEGL